MNIIQLTIQLIALLLFQTKRVHILNFYLQNFRRSFQLLNLHFTPDNSQLLRFRLHTTGILPTTNLGVCGGRTFKEAVNIPLLMMLPPLWVSWSHTVSSVPTESLHHLWKFSPFLPYSLELNCIKSGFSRLYLHIVTHNLQVKNKFYKFQKINLKIQN